MSTSKAWSSRITFLLASIGAAVGLGNLWRFPFVAGENGGGAFVLIYILFMLLICIPLVAAELAIGRRGGGSAIGSMQHLRKTEKNHHFWDSIGWLSIVIPFIALSFYSVIASWCLEYLFKAWSGVFTNLDGAGSKLIFDELLASPLKLIGLHTIIMGLTIAVVSLGLKTGLEKAVTSLIPLLFIILFVLVVFAAVNVPMKPTLKFLFAMNFEKVTSNSILLAFGQALFSVGLGVGALMTYGAYLPKKVSIFNSSIIIGVADTFVALLAGLAIFPFVFAFSLSPGEGPGLIFVTLPVAFGKMSGGVIIGGLFFSLLFFAAFTSALAMLEPVVCYLEEKLKLPRLISSCLGGLIIWFIGIGTALSFNSLSDFKPLSMISILQDKSIFGILDFFVSNVLLPLNAFLIAIYAGWIIKQSSLQNEIAFSTTNKFRIWHISIKYIAPPLILVIFILGFK